MSRRRRARAADRALVRATADELRCLAARAAVDRHCLSRSPWLNRNDAANRLSVLHLFHDLAGAEPPDTDLVVYACPYAGALGMPPHFHIGREASVASLERIADVMRFLRERTESDVWTTRAERLAVQAQRRRLSGQRPHRPAPSRPPRRQQERRRR